MDDTTPHRGAVLITGASTGIGRATALLLDQAGYSVFAGVRESHDAAGLRNEASVRLCPLTLDITNQAQIDAAAAVTRERLGPEGGLKALINDAGSVEAGPIELIAISRLRRQLEVNLIGHVAVIQAFLPLIRQGHGRIINVGSAAADCPMPFLGAYAASKAALRSMNTALRRDLRWWHIPVSLIQAGIVSSDIWSDADEQLETIRREDTHDRYSGPMEALYRRLQGLLHLAVSPT
jgi:NAD(P)-dependent dehydrogenase (short-subunit alcohol dehydrogenase family)